MSSISRKIRPTKADFIFGNSQESLEAKSGEQGGCYSSVIDFWARNCLKDSESLMSWSTVMVDNPIVRPNFRPLSTHSFRKPLQYSLT
jgi:hypothetical protein